MKCVLIVVLAAAIGAQAGFIPICPALYQPICASDGKTYDNQCVFDYAAKEDNSLKFLFYGTCEYSSWDEIVCNHIENPVKVCGSDGVTYTNQCFFEFAAKRNPSLRKRHDGNCEDAARSARSIGMVCGTDGKLYDGATFFAQKSVRPQLGQWPMHFCIPPPVNPGEPSGPAGPTPLREIPTVCGSDFLVYFEPTFKAQQAIRSDLYPLPLYNCYYKPFFQE